MTISLANRVLPKPVRDGIGRAIDPYVRLRANGDGQCARKTRDERIAFYHQMVAQLWELGYRIRKPESLAGKHVTALMNHWHSEGAAATTLHLRLSMIRVMCRFMDKHGVVKNIEDYLPADEVRRHTAAKESKAWAAKEVDPLEIIELAKTIDERLAVMLAMQHYFGLRVKESIEIRPANAVVEGGKAIELYEGTKGGRLRRVPIETPEQVTVIEWARRVAADGNSKRLRWSGISWKQARNKFYNLVRRRLGISGTALEVTPHGLRHGYAQRLYRAETGLPTPVQGGALGKIDRETHRTASLHVSRALGHGRVDVVAGYYGSYGHALRQTGPVTMTYKISTPA